MMESVYLLTGEEELIIQNKIDKLITDSKADAFNINVYDMEEENVSRAINDAMTPPFLCESKVVVIKKPIFLEKTKTSIEHNLTTLANYIKNPAPFTTLIINAFNTKLNEKLGIVKDLYKYAEVNDTKKASRIEAVGWLKRQFNLQGYVIEDSTCELFFNRIGESLLYAKNEVEKLITYLGEKRYIVDSDVNKVVTKDIERDVFALTSAIVSKDKESTINIYNDLIKAGNDSMALFSLVSKSINLMSMAKRLIENGASQNDIATSLDINYGRAGHIMSDCKRFSQNELDNYVVKFHNLDYKIKSGQIDQSTGIEFLILMLNR